MRINTRRETDRWLHHSTQAESFRHAYDNLNHEGLHTFANDMAVWWMIHSAVANSIFRRIKGDVAGSLA